MYRYFDRSRLEFKAKRFRICCSKHNGVYRLLVVFAGTSQHTTPNDIEMFVLFRSFHGNCHDSERPRMLFLYKLRAFENIVEWLPVFIIKAVAVVAVGKTATCVLLCIPYTVGKFMFAYGYGSGVSERRIPGLIVSDFFGLLVMRGILIIALVRHCMKA